jgi:hypothetical protein
MRAGISCSIFSPPDSVRVVLFADERVVTVCVLRLQRLGLSTLGEEYCDMVQVDAARRVPPSIFVCVGVCFSGVFCAHVVDT